MANKKPFGKHFKDKKRTPIKKPKFSDRRISVSSKIVNLQMYIGRGTRQDAEAVFAALHQFLCSVGYEKIKEGELKQGSWLKNAIYRFIDKNQDKLDIAEDVLYGHLSAKAEEKIVSSSAKLISALDNVDNVVCDTGHFLFLKTTVGDSSTAIVKRLTLKERALLNKRPGLLKNPADLLLKLPNLKKVKGAAQLTVEFDNCLKKKTG